MTYILDDILDCQYYPFMTYILDDILVAGAFRSMTMEAFIMGHSFVYGLQEHFSNKYRDPSSLEKMIAEELKVSHNIRRVWLWGKRGATVTTMIPPTLLLANIKPDITVIDLGTNDIVQGVSAQNIADRLMQGARELLSYTKVVVIMSVVPRTAGLRQQSAEEFRQKMNEVNEALKRHVSIHKDEPVIFVMQKGFYEMVLPEGGKCEKPVHLWSSDGIHPNFEGKELYKNSLRTALCRALKKL